jgi:hypothetical protein
MKFSVACSIQTTIERLLYSKASAMLESVKMQEAAEILEEDYRLSGSYHDNDTKGWMSPKGVSYIFPFNNEHDTNHHPDITRDIRRRKLKGDSGLAFAMKQGYARFGRFGDEDYIHYDDSSKHGKEAATHVMKFLKPKLGHTIRVAKKPWGNEFDADNDEHEFNSPSAANSHIRENYLQESKLFTHEIRGWMSPTGKVHLFPAEEEHCDNLHPDLRKKVKQGTFNTIRDANKLGYTRFGHAINDDGTEIIYVHYDKSSPKGRESAKHTLRYLKPSQNSKVIMTDAPGWSRNGNFNREKELTPSAAFRHIRENYLQNRHIKDSVLSEADPYPKVERDHKGEPVNPTIDQFRQYFESMAAVHIHDRLMAAHTRWTEAAEKAERLKISDSTEAKYAVANLKALEDEIKVAKEVLKSKSNS